MTQSPDYGASAGSGGSTGGKGQPSTSYGHGQDGPGGAGGQGVGDRVVPVGELAVQLSELARSLQLEQDVDATLAAIVHAAAGTVPGVQQASISAVTARHDVVTRASTGQLPLDLDRAQYESEQGPCLDSLYEEVTVRVADMRHEQRWPEFTRRAYQLGVGSMLAVQLFVDGDSMGALNLFSTDRDAFTDDSEHVALLFASHAAVAMAGAQLQEQMQRGLVTRDLIGQAKGILMERYKITGDTAFAVLVRYSQNANRKLHQVAQQLIDSGQLPADGATGTPSN